MSTPNSIPLERETFYISFNVRDRATYGDVTTALVLGNMETFLILNGDHRKAYKEADEEGGREACIAYFKANTDKIAKYSDKI